MLTVSVNTDKLIALLYLQKVQRLLNKTMVLQALTLMVINVTKQSNRKDMKTKE